MKHLKNLVYYKCRSLSNNRGTYETVVGNISLLAEEGRGRVIQRGPMHGHQWNYARGGLLMGFLGKVCRNGGF